MRIVSIGEINDDIIISISIRKECFIEKFHPLNEVIVSDLAKEDIWQEIRNQINISTE